jgi:hypothetical protein
MKRKKRSAPKLVDQEAQVPAWVLDEQPPKRRKPYTKAEIDALAAGVQAGIEDTPVWKECVRRFGKKEAAKILKLGLYRTHIVQGDPNN